MFSGRAIQGSQIIEGCRWRGLVKNANDLLLDNSNKIRYFKNMGGIDTDSKKRKLESDEVDENGAKENNSRNKVLKTSTENDDKGFSASAVSCADQNATKEVDPKHIDTKAKEEKIQGGEHVQEDEKNKKIEAVEEKKEDIDKTEKTGTAAEKTSAVNSDQTSSKFVFGSTTPFGNMGGFKMFGSDKNVFSSALDKNSKQKEVSGDSTTADDLPSEQDFKVQASYEGNGNKSNTPSKQREDADVKNKKLQVFGSGSTFGNAFKAAINKKSVFDELKSHSTKEEPDASSEKDVYKKVHLEKQEVKSGEENEETFFQVKAKLYHMELSKLSLGWKERGFGVIKVNKFIKSPAENYTSRLIMRQNGNLKLILNLPIVAGFQVLKGMPSSLTANKFIRLQVLEGGEPVQYAIKVGQPENAEKLYESIKKQIPD